MERVLRIADQYHGIFNAVEASFIPVDIIAAATNGHEADSSICLPQMKGELAYLLLYAAGVQHPVRLLFSERIKSKEILMSIGLISSMSNYQIQKELYGGKVAFIGYPVAEGTGTVVAFRGSAVAVNSQTKNQAGAWAFIKFYLLQGYDGQGFPVIKEQFDQVLEAAMKEDYIGTENGGSERNPKEHYNDGSGDIFVYAATPEDVDIIRKLVDSAENRFEPHSEIQNIINEEAEAYFTGQVDSERTTEKIQNRVTLLLQE